MGLKKDQWDSLIKIVQTMIYDGRTSASLTEFNTKMVNIGIVEPYWRKQSIINLELSGLIRFDPQAQILHLIDLDKTRVKK
jgi:hypothetical protein